mmetsp:Transcript_5267/g.15952  ORF Transcript_5267/g.15952 Transcript_5267/m.15952 type:complete len:310 (+) Transcript_5267:3056-3985(+)
MCVFVWEGGEDLQALLGQGLLAVLRGTHARADAQPGGLQRAHVQALGRNAWHAWHTTCARHCRGRVGTIALPAWHTSHAHRCRRHVCRAVAAAAGAGKNRADRMRWWRKMRRQHCCAPGQLVGIQERCQLQQRRRGLRTHTTARAACSTVPAAAQRQRAVGALHGRRCAATAAAHAQDQRARGKHSVVVSQQVVHPQRLQQHVARHARCARIMRDAQSPAQQVCKRPDTGRARAPVQAHQQQPLHAHKVWDAKHVVCDRRPLVRLWVLPLVLLGRDGDTRGRQQLQQGGADVRTAGQEAVKERNGQAGS